MHAIERDKEDPRNYDKVMALICLCCTSLWLILGKPFHTDTVCDCLGLVTRSCSAKGGKSILASVWTVYNELAATRPDLIHVLT